MLMHFPKALRTRWFEKSTDVCPHVRNGSRSPQWCSTIGIVVPSLEFSYFGRQRREGLRPGGLLLRLLRARHEQLRVRHNRAVACAMADSRVVAKAVEGVAAQRRDAILFEEGKAESTSNGRKLCRQATLLHKGTVSVERGDLAG